MLIMALYNQTTPSLKYVSLAEEWLPFTDILPSATIGWAAENMPGLLEEWKDLYEANGGVGGLMMIGSGKSENFNSDSADDGKFVSGSAGVRNMQQPTAEQKRSILRDMQGMSHRLSVKS